MIPLESLQPILFNFILFISTSISSIYWHFFSRHRCYKWGLVNRGYNLVFGESGQQSICDENTWCDLWPSRWQRQNFGQPYWHNTSNYRYLYRKTTGRRQTCCLFVRLIYVQQCTSRIWFMYDSVPGYEKNVHCHDRFLYDFVRKL